MTKDDGRAGWRGAFIEQRFQSPSGSGNLKKHDGPALPGPLRQLSAWPSALPTGQRK